MREHLLGYVMGALEPHEAEAVRQSLEADDVLRRELDVLRSCLEPLAADAGQFDPPAGLAERTCNYVAAQVETTLVRVAPGRASRWSLADVAMAATVLIAATAVFFPAVQQSRTSAQMAGCQNNLRQGGVAVAQYSDAHGGILLPATPKNANQAVAGYLAVELHGKGYADERIFVCPGSALASVGDFHVPSQTEVLAATGEKLAQMQRMLSGSYGFTLGFVQDDQPQPIRYRSRAGYAVMSDAPSLELASYQTSNHGARGQNVLFEDGHVRYMRTCQDCPYSDDVFHNVDGELAPGKHVDDSVIGPSHWPLEWVRAE
jgi:hypothetical protein